MMNKIDMNKKYKTRGGQDVRILCTDYGHDGYPVVAIFDGDSLGTFTSTGYYRGSDDPSRHDLIEVSPYDHLKIDDKVVVWSDTLWGTQHKQHFAGLSADGRPRAFSNGRTSHTQYDTTVWDQCELYCPVLHKNI